jgi:hypothetical protein
MASAVYFGAVKGCTVLPVSSVPQWLVNTIVANGAAVALDIKEPDGLFVVRKGPAGPAGPVAPSFATVDESGVVMRTDRATPFRVFVGTTTTKAAMAAKTVHYIQVPAGALDSPEENKITVLALSGKKVIQSAMSVNPDPRYGLVAGPVTS